MVVSIESVITHTTYQGYNVFFNPSGQLSSHLDWRNDGQAVVMDLTFTLGDAGTVSTSFTPDGAGGSYSFVDSEVLSGWGYFFYMTTNSSSDSTGNSGGWTASMRMRLTLSALPQTLTLPLPALCFRCR